MAAFNCKIIFLVAVIFLASIVVSEAVKYNCKEGEEFKDLCNTCHCGKNGDAACTKMECKKPGEEGFTCTPHESFKDECNSCVCNCDGESATCTLMACA